MKIFKIIGFISALILVFVGWQMCNLGMLEWCSGHYSGSCQAAWIIFSAAGLFMVIGGSGYICMILTKHFKRR